VCLLFQVSQDSEEGVPERLVQEVRHSGPEIPVQRLMSLSLLQESYVLTTSCTSIQPKDMEAVLNVSPNLTALYSSCRRLGAVLVYRLYPHIFISCTYSVPLRHVLVPPEIPFKPVILHFMLSSHSE